MSATVFMPLFCAIQKIVEYRAAGNQTEGDHIADDKWKKHFGKPQNHKMSSPLLFFQSIILQKTTAASVEIAVAASAGPSTASGCFDPYSLR